MNQQQIQDGLLEIQIIINQNGQAVSFTNTLISSDVSQFIETVLQTWQSNQNQQNQQVQNLNLVSEIYSNHQLNSNKLMPFTHYILKIQDLEQDISQMKSQIQSQKKEITRLEQFIQEQNKLLDRHEKLHQHKNEAQQSMNSIQNKDSQPVQSRSQVEQMYKFKPKIGYDDQY